MKTFFYKISFPLLLLCALCFTGFSQDNKIYTNPEKSPIYPGGKEALIKFLKENIKYPEPAAKDSLKGTVEVSFIIEKNGIITGLEVTKGIGKGCDEEALRVIRKMPKWYPGSTGGKPVRTLYKLIVKFPQ